MKNHLNGASLLALALAMTPGVLFAQTAEPAGAVEEIVVTGSRVARVGFVAPTPVTSMGAEQLSAANPSNIGDALRQLPILAATSGARGGTGSIGNGGSFLNLRRLGSNRTLTLLDGRRFVPSAGSGVPDTALFPQALVERVEIVTGGASAAYGSDAVAGVVNFILDKDYTGFKGEIMGGISNVSDLAEQKLTLTAGLPFSGGKGHFIASMEYFHSEGVHEEQERESARRSCSVITATGAATSRIFACDVRVSNANFGGLITAGPLRGTTFDTRGNPVPFDFGTNSGSSTQIGGDGINPNFLPLQVPVDRATLFTRASWDLTENVTGFLEANYGSAEYEYQVGSYSQMVGPTALTVFRDNAYLTPAFRQQLVTSNVQNFRLGRQSRDLPKSWIRNLNYTARAVAGLEGDLGPVKWQAHYQHGENRRSLKAEYNLLIDKYQEASDAVFNAAGQITCRSTIANPGNGCVPINVIGEHTPTAQQLGYVTGTNFTTGKTVEDSMALEASGDVFSLPAGAISLAGGLEYRKESLRMGGDPRSLEFSPLSNAQGPYRVGNYRAQRGSFDVKEAFLETVVPIAKDLPWIQELDFNGAVRRTEYSTSGGVTTWKAGLTYRPADFIRFRTTRSRDIRAPNITELFDAGNTQRTVSFLDQGRDPPRLLSQVLNIGSGNPNLQPEIADTLTFGTVISPTFAPGLDISVDAYDIEIKGAIATVGGPQSTLDCRNGSAEACARIVRNADGDVITSYSVPINLAVIKTSGIDVEVAYRFNVEDVIASVPGSINLRFLGNYVEQFYTQAPGARVVDRTGDSAQPAWRWTMLGAYKNGPFSISGQARYTGSGAYDSTTLATDLPQRNIDGQVLIDTRVAYDFARFGGDYTVFLNVNNITDKQRPDFVGQFDQSNFDSVGRYFRVGVTFAY